MVKEKYHHGDLKRELLKKGLQLLNKDGYENFSLRKVAIMCGVSHAAPYKHFRSKEELIAAIIADVSKSFISVIADVMHKFTDDPKARTIEMGKQYVKFMVENPDYFKFIFLTDHHNPILINNDVFIMREGHPFDMAKKCAADYYSSINLNEKDQTLETLSLWGMIHGFAVLLVHNTISYSGDYLELLERMLDAQLSSIRHNS
ncbi:MAG TPA: TetR/AcrR family transcriptional regulator [Clostridia bacterium]|nr:TetR/AcrR family transcriptional regulator [Clostridia bacterium]